MRRWALVVSCLLTLCFSREVSAQQSEVEGKKARRVVALSSLSADLVVSINPDVLIGVPGSSLTNQDPRYSGLKRVSNGRSQPSVELILALNPDLVIGAEGFHSRVLNALNKLGVQTLAIKVNRWDSLEQASHTLEARIVNAGSIDSRLSQLCPSQKSSKFFWTQRSNTGWCLSKALARSAELVRITSGSFGSCQFHQGASRIQ